MRQLLIFVAGITGFTCAQADESQRLYQDQQFSISASIGKMQVQANEALFYTPTGQKVSELDWHTHSLDIVSADMRYAVNRWFTLGARGWMSLARGNAVMDDYDWDDPARNTVTRWSHHPTTRQQYANEIDINGTFWLLQQPAYKIGVVAGYQRSQFSWRSYGGHYVYEDAIFGPLWIHTFDVPDSVLVLGYKQTFNTPYLGVAAAFRQGPWSVNMLARFSHWTTVHADDEHYSHSMSYRSTLRGGNYYALAMDIGYTLSARTTLFAQASYSHNTMSSQGSTQVFNRKTGSASSFTVNNAGAENRAHSLSAGLRYAF